MIFHATSPCSWLSECKRYHICLEVVGFGITVYRVTHDGQTHAEMGLQSSQDWCRNHSLTLPTPEVDLPRLMESGR